MTPRRDERGAGLFSTVAGLVVFLALLLFAVETLIGLYTRSVVADAAWHGVRIVAGARTAHDDGPALDEARTIAEQGVRTRLGRFGERVTMDWSSSDADTVRLTISATPPGFLWRALRPAAPRMFSRTVSVRIEQWR